MRFIKILICTILLSFLGGLIYGTIKAEVPKIIMKSKPVNEIITTGILKPCSEVETMPCEVSPPNPVKDNLDAYGQRTGLFKKGEQITCIYSLVKSRHWSDGTDEEYIENVGVICKVLVASEEHIDIEPNYQQLKVKCNLDVYGIVKKHKLNKVERWFAGTDCYHFVQQ